MLLLGAVALAVAVAFAFAVAVAVADTFRIYIYTWYFNDSDIFIDFLLDSYWKSVILRLFFSSGAGACVMAVHASALDCIVKPNSLEQANSERKRPATVRIRSAAGQRTRGCIGPTKGCDSMFSLAQGCIN